MTTERTEAGAGRGAGPGSRAWVQQLMGMSVSIHVRGPLARSENVAAAVERAFGTLHWVDETFSTYRTDSAISRLRRGDVDLEQLAGPIREVAELCRQAETVTAGAFTAMLPDSSGTLAFDPTGLVKGWALQRASAHLRTLARHRFCINAGGDLVAGRGCADVVDKTAAADDATGSGQAGPWRVGIQDPADPNRIVRVELLADGGLATSGAAARGAHLYDPKAADWVSPPGSVTVIGPSIIWADVWATAIAVGGAPTAALLASAAPVYRLVLL